MDNNVNEVGKPQQKSGKVSSFFKRVFVHNIGWKILAVCSAFLMWVLAAGLN